MKENKDTEQLILESAMKEFSAKGNDGARTASRNPFLKQFLLCIYD